MQDRYDILTDRGPAAITVVRLRGSGVPRFLTEHVRFASQTLAGAPPADRLEPGRILRAALLDGGEPIDDALLSVHRAAPDWDVRLHLHGGRWIVRRCSELLESAGFAPSPQWSGSPRPTPQWSGSPRPDAQSSGPPWPQAQWSGPPCPQVPYQPDPLWPASNAVEAEAHALLPRMKTLAGATWLLRQAAALPAALRELRGGPCNAATAAALRAIVDRGAAFDWYATPVRIALVGPPNAGKSTLANALAGRDAALVSPTPGTTRDWLEIPAEIGGFPAVWLDTAGLRPTDDPLEAAGIERTRRVMAGADAVVVILDSDPAAFELQRSFADGYAADCPACVLLNKSDRFDARRPAMLDLARRWSAPALAISAVDGAGIGPLTDVLLRSLSRDRDDLDAPSAFTDRQCDGLCRAAAACDTGDERVCRTALSAIL